MIVVGFLCMRHLRLCRPLTRRATGCRFRVRRLCRDPACAVERVVRARHIPDNGAVLVDIAHVVAIDPADRGVVMELFSDPASAGEAGAEVAVPVIHAAVESDLRTPVSRAPNICGAIESPINRASTTGRGPEEEPTAPVPSSSRNRRTDSSREPRCSRHRDKEIDQKP